MNVIRAMMYHDVSLTVKCEVDERQQLFAQFDVLEGNKDLIVSFDEE